MKTLKPITLGILVLGVLFAIAVRSAFSAPITWQPAQNTTGASNLLTGYPAFARNGGSNTVTVSGIAFTLINLGAGFLANVYTASGGPGSMTSTGDANFDALIASLTDGGGFEHHHHDHRPHHRSLYKVQVFYNDQRSSESSRVMTYGDGLGNNVNVAAGAQAGAQSNDYGQFAIGAFTADAATQTLSLSTDGLFANCHLNALLVTVQTNTTPTAIFTANPTVGAAPLTVVFTNLTTGATNYAWDFGDGNLSTNANPANTYTNPGLYSVTLTAIGPGGTNTLTRANYINGAGARGRKAIIPTWSCC